ncbi:MAG: type VI secretion system-associated FHA domain protein TagH [Gammaproteobacteria bacterium]|nr:type VI secretion system-associated FHA domain protein TagH [Gammaproteobacteria bacterium]
MTLILTITNQSFTEVNQEPSCRFDEGGNIGRSTGNDWVLHDPSRYISGKHAVINQRDGIFYITDTSTNGIYVGNAETPLGKGNTAQLNHGDRIRIGQFDIDVAAETMPLAETPPPPPTRGDSLGLMDILEQPTAPSVPGLDTAPEALIPSTPVPPPEDPLGQEHSSLIPPEPELGTVPAAGSSTDHAQVLSEHFSPPSAIPENWNFLSEPKPDQTPAAGPAPGEQTPPIPDLTPPPPMESAPVMPAPAQAPSTAIAETTAPPATSPSATEPQQPAARSQSLLTALLEGMGASDLPIPPEADEDFMRTVGEMLRETVEGMVKVLRARTAIKSEFRMDMTTIKSRENNPLKFSVGTDEVLKHLFVKQSADYLPPLQSLREGFEDIEAHQMAMMAGMQAALTAVLKQFDPTRLAQQFEQANGHRRILPGSQKAKYWSAYEGYYGQIMERIEDDFQSQFGHEFSLIYEEQVARLKLARRENGT